MILCKIGNTLQCTTLRTVITVLKHVQPMEQNKYKTKKTRKCIPIPTTNTQQKYQPARKKFSLEDHYQQNNPS